MSRADVWCQCNDYLRSSSDVCQAAVIGDKQIHCVSLTGVHEILGNQSIGCLLWVSTAWGGLAGLGMLKILEF